MKNGDTVGNKKHSDSKDNHNMALVVSLWNPGYETCCLDLTVVGWALVAISGTANLMP